MCKGEEKNFYAISKGLCPPCIVESWACAGPMVTKYPNNEFKGFATFTEAKDWLLGCLKLQQSGESAFHFMMGPWDGPKCQEARGHPEYYVVIRGRIPGIYTNFDDAKAQVTGWSGAVFKSYATREAAETVWKHYSEGKGSDIESDEKNSMKQMVEDLAAMGL